MIQSFMSCILYQTFTKGDQQKSRGEKKKNLLKDLYVQIGDNIKKGC